MPLNERIMADRTRVFVNMEHFAEWHTWKGLRFQCVTDEEAALKRKNNNVVDLSWDNNTTETMLHVRVEDFPGRAVPNEHGYFDNRPMKILQVQEDMGMYTILLASFDPKAVAL